MRSPYTREPLPDPIAGRWQIYGKAGGYWVPSGPPMSRPNAVAEVAIIKAEGRLREPHAVPL